MAPRGRPSLPCIYGLFCKDGHLRYIGKANNPKARLDGHMRDSHRRNSPLYAWIRKHGRPEIRILESDCASWQDSERRLISEARARGERLLNVADGGDQPFCSPETRSENGKRLSERLKADPEFARIRDLKRSLACAIKDGFLCNDSRAKLRIAAKLKPAMFGSYLHLPDRPENPDGTPLGGFRINERGRVVAA